MLLSLNKEVYDEKSVVDRYANNYYLDKPEISFLYMLGDRLKGMKVLDIGVGGGRTTFYFAPLAGDYMGIDYAENMVSACERQFPDRKFTVCDVRNMEMFGDGTFDLALFSMNGLDSIPHEDRLLALREIKRVIKPGGIFFFSAHNIQFIRDLKSRKVTMDPHGIYYFLYRYLLLLFNGPALRRLSREKHAVINDGAHQARLKLYYIEPEEQVNQLRKVGFKNIRVLSITDGLEVRGPLGDITDQWLGYLCEA